MLYIYKTTNLANGKIYVGFHKGELNDSYIGSGKILRSAIKKYGKENFKKEVLEIVDEDNWQEREIYWIEKSGSFSNGYNLTAGGNGCLGMSRPKDELYREKLRNSVNEFYKNNPEHKTYLSKLRTGKSIMTEREKKFRSKKYSGKGNPFYGKTHNKETRRKLAKAASKYKWFHIKEDIIIEIENLNEYCNEHNINMLGARKSANTGKPVAGNLFKKELINE
jgi:group I intron endonuclease